MAIQKIMVDETLHNFKIEEVFLFIATDGNQEGLPAMQMGNVLMPLVAADKKRLADLRVAAQKIADVSGKPIRLCRYSHREELEVISPASKRN